MRNKKHMDKDEEERMPKSKILFSKIKCKITDQKRKK